jgi:beta-glucuronidase
VLQVPGDWNTQADDLLYYEGTVWYLRHFSAEPQPGLRYFLWFGAANYEAKVALNGEILGSHRGGFTPFQFEVTDRIVSGDNVLLAKVDNTRHAAALPALAYDWWNYGGLTRDVLLIETPAVFVRGWHVGLTSLPGTIAGWVQLDGVTEPTPVTVRLPELGIEERIATDGAGRAVLELEVTDLEPWSPESPRLYDVVITGGRDRVEDRIGFRTIAVEDGEILLNGRPIYLRGINSHAEATPRPGRAWGPADAARLLDWVEELDANFLRLAHYPHDEAIVRLADERGILLWAELPIYWNIDFGNPETLELAKRMLGEVVDRDRNRAAVILWSVANETPRTDDRLAFLASLISHARSLDPDRLITAALLPTSDPQALAMALARKVRRSNDAGVSFEIVLDDPLGELLDVVGHNAYYGWYYASPMAVNLGLPVDAVREAMLEAMPHFSWSMPWSKPLVFSEFGAGARAGLHGTDDEVWTEQYQARAYRAQLAMIDAIPFVRGTAPWILCDFRSPMRQLQGIQDGWNRKGVISNDGKKKLAFEVLRAHYAQKRAQWQGR